MSEATPRPWEACPSRKGDGGSGPHDFVIVGNITDPVYEGGELIEDASCVVIAHVKGNDTSGGIPKANAEIIVRAVNAHDALVAACALVSEWLDAVAGQLGVTTIHNEVKAAIAKAEARS